MSKIIYKYTSIFVASLLIVAGVNDFMMGNSPLLVWISSGAMLAIAVEYEELRQWQQ